MLAKIFHIDIPRRSALVEVQLRAKGRRDIAFDEILEGGERVDCVRGCEVPSVAESRTTERNGLGGEDELKHDTERGTRSSDGLIKDVS